MEVPRSLAGTRFGPYEVRSLLGRGGMGEVYEAFDTVRDRVVALKVLPEQLAMDPAYPDRFHRESQAVARLAEPHIVPVHDSGAIDGILFVDMRLVRGESLRTLLRRQGPLAPDRAVAIVEQVAAALDAAHSAGLVHRDVKPANVLVTPSDFAYLADFGIARSDGESAVTTAGHAAGTYTYMAPERFDSGPITARADIYSLACVLYECLTGTTPFPAQSVSVLIRSHLSEPPPNASAERPDVPASMDAVIARAMAKAPVDRYQTAGRFAAAARTALAAGERANAANTVVDPPTTIFGAELLAEPPRPTEQPRTADSSRPADRSPDSGPTAGEVAAAGANDYRREPEPTTFQPFGPEGPTIAANFQPRGGTTTDAPQTDSPAAAAPTSGPTAATLNSPAAQSVPQNPASEQTDRTGDVPPATSPAYETTGTLRIIAPPSQDEHDTSGDLPVIHPSDPTSVKPGEFNFSPLQGDADAPRVDPPRVPPTGRPQAPAPMPSIRAEAGAVRDMIGGYDEPDTGRDTAGDPEPGSEHRTQLLDPVRLRAESGPDPRTGYGAGSRMAAGADTTAPSDGDTRFLDVSQFGTVADSTGDTQYLDIAGLRGENAYDDSDYDDDYNDDAYDEDLYDEDDAGDNDSRYPDEDADYRNSGYRAADYDDSDEGVIRRYEDDLRYTEPATEDSPYDTDDIDPEGEFAFAASDYDDAEPAKRSRSVGVPVVLGVLGVAVLAGIGVVGWQVFGSSSSSDRPAAVAGPATAAPRQAPPSAGTTTASPTTTTGTAALPVGATPCAQTSSSRSAFGKAATGSSVTSCGFAEAVREAYAENAESHGTTSAASADASTSIIAVSPVTGRSYPMTCTSSGKVITCTGGDNAVVYVY